jgi:hypothetical protein
MMVLGIKEKMKEEKWLEMNEEFFRFSFSSARDDTACAQQRSYMRKSPSSVEQAFMPVVQFWNRRSIDKQWKKRPAGMPVLQNAQEKSKTDRNVRPTRKERQTRISVSLNRELPRELRGLF